MFSARCCQKANNIYASINIETATATTILDIFEISSIIILFSDSISLLEWTPKKLAIYPIIIEIEGNNSPAKTAERDPKINSRLSHLSLYKKYLNKDMLFSSDFYSKLLLFSVI